MNSSLPTLFYSLNDHPNWQLCYKLSDGSWIFEDYVSIHYCSRMLVHCGKLGIEAKARLRTRTRVLILLNLFFNRLTDRSPKKLS